MNYFEELINQCDYDELLHFKDKIDEEVEQRKTKMMIKLKKELFTILKAMKRVNPHEALIDNCDCEYYLNVEDLLYHIKFN